MWKNTAINNFISGLALTQDENDLDDLVFFHNSISSSSFINFRAENVKFDAKSKNANHCFEIAGQYIELNNVHVKSNNGHPFY